MRHETTADSPRWRGARERYVALALGTVALGLAVHWRGDGLSPVVRDVLGDALWAVMVVWWIAALAPVLALSRRATVACAFCFLVELSQLYRAPWLDAIRETTVGHLMLGSDFDWRDLGAYAAGVLGAVLLERAVTRALLLPRKGSNPGPPPSTPTTSSTTTSSTSSTPSWP
jgi:hypothetical protein